MHNFRERAMPIRDRALHEAAVRAALELVARDGLDRATLTAVAQRLRLPGAERVSERTLRRRYGSTARLLFGTPWWMPDPADAVRAVLAPRPRRTEGPVWPGGAAAEAAAAVVDDCRCEGGVPARDPRDRPAGCACEDGRTDDTWPDAAFFTDAGIDDPLGDLAHASPEPIALRDLLHDLHAVLTGHLVATGWAANLPWVGELRTERPEVGAWLALAAAAWADALAPKLARVFGLDATGGAAAAAAFSAVARELEPMVGELGAAHYRAARGFGPAASAEADLAAARARAFDALTAVVSVPDRIGEPRGRSTVRPGGRYASLPNRARRPGATG
ncbi:hypothetical protein FK529_13150 [Tsukamurella asaccharolytica]|uniref:Uncharacterized protein n=1 Tax=Tsukamurella asaccharolytica TaxID=2592067 RepID=A0A5C5R9B3_9ACTN|nr:hypothetical protein [Tsukamurella asaccharolytica]TWS18923.1 hypothetical protein FK529_13150 [Tsukamurella asaccharolytica]